MMLSAVAAIVTNYKAVRIYTAGDDWYTVLLEGLLDNTPIQLIDQVHINENELVDHVSLTGHTATAQDRTGLVWHTQGSGKSLTMQWRSAS